MRKLASLIAKYEGKKSQARIGDIREILKILHAMGASQNPEHDAAADECSKIFSAMQVKAAKLRAKGLSPDEIFAKLIGAKAK